jgi:hypothetical protein
MTDGEASTAGATETPRSFPIFVWYTLHSHAPLSVPIRLVHEVFDSDLHLKAGQPLL